MNNPFTWLAAQIGDSSQQPETAALAYLCPLFAAGWTPAHYVNRCDPIISRLQQLADSPLRREMIAAVNSRRNIADYTYTP